MDKKMINSSVCVISRNESEMLKEFISHHIKVGFDRIFVYDNNDSVDKSNLDAIDTLSNDEKGKIEYVEFDKDLVLDFEGKIKPHAIHFKDNFSMQSKYTAHIDTDEFFWFGGNITVNSFFEKNNFSVAKIKRKTFFNLSETIEGSILNSCTERFRRIDAWTKPIILNSKHGGGFLNAHDPINIAGNSVCFNHEEVCLNHYWVTSFENFRLKILKSRDYNVRLCGGEISRLMCSAASSNSYEEFLLSDFVKRSVKRGLITDMRMKKYIKNLYANNK